MVQTKYEAKVIFEASIDTNGHNYLVIYGKHINGYFCCIPNWNLGCEMTEPSDTYYNTQRLIVAGVKEPAAKEIAKDIQLIVGESKLCAACKYQGRGAPDGDCIYAGICFYGFSDEGENK